MICAVNSQPCLDSVRTSGIGRAFGMSERIQAGTVWVNAYRAASFMSPFGGFKDSGLGR